MRGLNNNLKRRAVFKYFKDRELDVVFMQEVHCNKKLVQIWQNEWGSKWHVSYGDTRSCGTVIMFNPKRKMKINECVSDQNSRRVVCNIQMDDEELMLCNLYALNSNNVTFFKQSFCQLQKLSRDNIVLGGDCNTFTGKQPCSHLLPVSMTRNKETF